MRELSLQLMLRIILGCSNPGRLAALTELFTVGTQIAENPAMLVPLHVQQRLGQWSPWSKICKKSGRRLGSTRATWLRQADG